MLHPVKIYVYTFCYNNSAIIPFVIDYWKKYATKVIVYDNNSTDNSVELLKAYNWIEVRSYNTNNVYDINRINEIKTVCYKECTGEADLCMVCDIDEVLAYYDGMMDDIFNRMSDYDVFKAVQYDIVKETFPNYVPDCLAQNYEGTAFVKSPNANKIALFKPEVNIEFTHNSYFIHSGVNSDNIKTLHIKIFGHNYLIYNEAVLEARLPKSITNKKPYLPYGVGLFGCSDVLRWYAIQAKAKNVHLFDEQITYNKNDRPAPSKSTDIIWTPARIQYNNSHENKDICIVIPVYKSFMSIDEAASLKQLVKIMDDKYDIILVGPSNLYFEYYSNTAAYKFNILKCCPDYFRNIAGYSMLCETAEFYKCFSDYKFMFLYQLDGWIFKDSIKKFELMDYDYIGSPWMPNVEGCPFESVGNGGVSFRKIQTFIDICGRLDETDFKDPNAWLEDVFFCRHVKSKEGTNFNIAPVNAAVSFAWDVDPQHWMDKAGELPMACHAWKKNSFWTRNNYIQYDNGMLQENTPETAKILNEIENQYKSITEKKQREKQAKNKAELSIQQKRIKDINSNLNKINQMLSEPLKISETSNDVEPEDLYKVNVPKVIQRTEQVKLVKQPKQKAVESPAKRNNLDFNVALCAIAKNENAYLREWVEYHLKIGFSHIFLYDNNELDGERFEDVIGDYVNDNIVTVIDVRGIEKGKYFDEDDINLQTKCYIECYKKMCTGFDWVAFFDIDEFIQFNGQHTLQSMLQTYSMQHYGCVLVPWVWYDDNNLLEYSNEPVFKRFTRKSKYNNPRPVKSIVRVGCDIYNYKLNNMIHYFKLYNQKTIITNGEIVTHPAYNVNWLLCKKSIDGAIAQLNHYKTKTIDEFMKRHVGRAWGTIKAQIKFSRTHYDALKDFYLYNYFNEKKANIMNKTLPGKKAVIAMTSWTKRIQYVAATIQNIINKCGTSYHIVLTLCTDEFNNKEKDLPKELMELVNGGHVELLWVKRNYNCYKKVLFAMQKYPDVPIISADDDCMYKYDYASELYNKWLKNPINIITSLKKNVYRINNQDYKFSHGRCTIFPPSCLLRLLPFIEDQEILDRKNDDSLYGCYAKLEKIEILYLEHSDAEVMDFSTNNDSITYEALHANLKQAKNKFLADKLLFIKKLHIK